MKLAPLLLGLASAWCAAAAHGEQSYRDYDLPPHRYHERAPQDHFSRLKDDLESGKIPLERGSDQAFVASLLRALGVPVTSQMLVFSTTSLQLKLISPGNPRALYFSEDTYVGWVPGGRIEVLSLDPELGAVFYIFDVPRTGQPLHVERSERCMNCHAGDDTGRVPGLVIKSVVPGPGGGSLTAFRLEQTGHAIPFEQRFGGWYVTGHPEALGPNWSNIVGHFSAGNLLKTSVLPEPALLARSPVATSDLLPQLLHEHQAGFVNRAVQAGYRARTALFLDEGQLSAAHAGELDEQARLLTRYLLFADEAPLPAKGLQVDRAFATDFLGARRRTREGGSLRDLDLQDHLFRNRCSYMIYSAAFAGLPPAMKDRVFRRLQQALDPRRVDPEFAYLPQGEKAAIRAILAQTLPDLPRNW